MQTVIDLGEKKTKMGQLSTCNCIFSDKQLHVYAFKRLLENLIRLKVIDLSISQLRYLD